MGDPAEENDPPPESSILFSKRRYEVNAQNARIETFLSGSSPAGKAYSLPAQTRAV
jgi:hypothetical protein